MPGLDLPTPPIDDDDAGQGDDYLRDLDHSLREQLAPVVVSNTRPTSTTASPGIAGRLHVNPMTGLASIDTGVGWLELGTRDIVVPIGGMIETASTDEPAGGRFLFADGRSLVRADYPELFAEIGTMHGAPSGSLFKIPDTRGASSIAPSNMGTAQGARNGNDTVAINLGARAGEVAHQLAITELPAHDHNGKTGDDSPDHGHGVGISVASNNGPTSAPGPANAYFNANATFRVVSEGASARHQHLIAAQGGNGGHNTVHPVIALPKLIRVR